MQDSKLEYTRVSEILKWIEDRDRKTPMTSFQEIARNRKGKVGTNVHSAIDVLVHGGFPIVDAEENSYVESFEIWKNANSPSYRATEKRYFDHKNKITGQIDGLIQIDEKNENILIDYKVSAQESPLWILQAHFYYHLLLENLVDNISPRFFFIQLKNEKKADLVTGQRLYYSKPPKVYEYCFDQTIYDRCLLEMKNYFEEHFCC